MSIIAFSDSKLQDIIKKSKEQNNRTTQNNENSIRAAFLPHGVHKVRIFGDSMSELYREFVLHRYEGAKVLCPDDLQRRNPKAEGLPTCDICKMMEEGYGDWSLRRYYVSVFMQVIETSVPGDYWAPGKVYCVQGNSKLRKAVVTFIDSMLEDAKEWVLGMLNPNVQGGYVTMTVEGGTQGSVAIVPVMMKTVEPPSLYIPQWRTHAECYMPEFDVIEYKKIVTELGKTTPKKEEEEAPSDATTTTPEQSTPASTQPQETPAATSPAVESKEVAATTTPAVEQKTETAPVVEKKVDPAPTSTPAGTPPVPDDITLPQAVIDAGCWSQYNAAKPPCAVCAVNLECMSSGI